MEEILEYLQVQMLELVLCNIFLNNLEKYAVKPPDIQTLLLHVVKCHTNGEETQKGFTDPSKSAKFLIKENPLQNRLHLH